MYTINPSIIMIPIFPPISNANAPGDSTPPNETNELLTVIALHVQAT